jgi:hypothetical protein
MLEKVTYYPFFNTMQMLILTIGTLKKRGDRARLKQLDGISRLKTFAKIIQLNIGLWQRLSINHCDQHQEQHHNNCHLSFSFRDGRMKVENDAFSFCNRYILL